MFRVHLVLCLALESPGKHASADAFALCALFRTFAFMLARLRCLQALARITAAPAPRMVSEACLPLQISGAWALSPPSLASYSSVCLQITHPRTHTRTRASD